MRPTECRLCWDRFTPLMELEILHIAKTLGESAAQERADELLEHYHEAHLTP